MLPSVNRLNLKDEKKLNGQKIRGEEFTLVYGKEPGIWKLGIIVSKKIAKNATDRNRIKRVISEALVKETIEGKLLVIVNKNVAKLKTGDISKVLKNQIAQIK